MKDIEKIKQDIIEVRKIIIGIVRIQKKIAVWMERSHGTHKILASSSEKIFVIIKINLFIVGILVWKVFLWDLLNMFVGALFSRWGLLPEAYRSVLLGLTGTFVVTLLAQIAGNWISDYFKGKRE